MITVHVAVVVRTSFSEPMSRFASIGCMTLVLNVSRYSGPPSGYDWMGDLVETAAFSILVELHSFCLVRALSLGTAWVDMRIFYRLARAHQRIG